MFVLTKLILKEFDREGIVSAIIYGKYGVGKSMYCIKTAYQVYVSRGYSEEKAWELALRSIVFKPQEFGDKLHMIGDDVTPIIIVDDASVHIGSDSYQTNPKLYSAYKQVLTTIRTKTHAILLNCPMVNELAKFIREGDSYQIHITKAEGSRYDRKATIYDWYVRNWRTGPRRYRKKKGEDYYSVYIPKDVYNKYIEKRKTYLESPIEKLRGYENGDE